MEGTGVSRTEVEGMGSRDRRPADIGVTVGGVLGRRGDTIVCDEQGR